jgi:hypothetical protein
MKNKKLITQLMILSGIIAVLLLALLADTLTNALITNAQNDTRTLQFLVFLEAFLQFFFMLVGVGLFWVIATNRDVGRGVRIVYLVVGLILLYSTAFMFIYPFPDSWYILTAIISPGNFFYQVSAMFAAIGLLSLYLWKPANEKKDKVEIEEKADEGAVIEPEASLTEDPGVDI